MVGFGPFVAFGAFIECVDHEDGRNVAFRELRGDLFGQKDLGLLEDVIPEFYVLPCELKGEGCEEAIGASLVLGSSRAIKGGTE